MWRTAELRETVPQVSLLPVLTRGTLYPKTFGKRISVTLISNDC